MKPGGPPLLVKHIYHQTVPVVLHSPVAALRDGCADGPFRTPQLRCSVRGGCFSYSEAPEGGCSSQLLEASSLLPVLQDEDTRRAEARKKGMARKPSEETKEDRAKFKRGDALKEWFALNGKPAGRVSYPRHTRLRGASGRTQALPTLRELAGAS